MKSLYEGKVALKGDNIYDDKALTMALCLWRSPIMAIVLFRQEACRRRGCTALSSSRSGQVLGHFHLPLPMNVDWLVIIRRVLTPCDDAETSL